MPQETRPKPSSVPSLTCIQEEQECWIWKKVGLTLAFSKVQVWLVAGNTPRGREEHKKGEQIFGQQEDAGFGPMLCVRPNARDPGVVGLCWLLAALPWRWGS